MYVQMSSVEEAKAALLALKGRTFDGRIVDVKFFPESQLEVNPSDFTDPKPYVTTAAGLISKEFYKNASRALKEDGILILNHDDEKVYNIHTKANRRTVSYGMNNNANEAYFVPITSGKAFEG